MASIAFNGGVAFRVVNPMRLGPIQLARAVVGSADWAPVAVPNSELFVDGFVDANRLVAAGASLYLYDLFGINEQHVLRSDDGGLSWSPVQPTCRDSSTVPTQAGLWPAAAAGGLLAIQCTRKTEPRWQLALQISTDSGAHLSPMIDGPLGVQFADALTILTPNELVALVYSGHTHEVVWRSADGGHSWTQTFANRNRNITPIPFSTLTFQDAMTGRLSLGTDAIWTTHDGGQTWQETVLP